MGSTETTNFFRKKGLDIQESGQWVATTVSNKLSFARKSDTVVSPQLGETDRENHGGTMTVGSWPGKGTRFTISLPLDRLLQNDDKQVM